MTDVHAIAERFAGDIASITPFGHGHINETMLVQAATGEFVLQRINRSVFPDPGAVTANILTAHRHLRGAFVPEPVATRDGRWLIEAGEDAWRAWRRVPDAEPATSVTRSIAASAGQLLGRFHAALGGLDPTALMTTLPGFHDLRGRLDDLRAAVDADPCDRVSTVRPEVEMALAASPLVDQAEHLVQQVPTRVAHYDAKLDNVLFREGEAVCLVDLDTLMPGQWIWDVGDLLRTASTTAAEDDDSDDAVVDPNLYDAVLDGYRAAVATAATPAETEALESAGAIVTYEQAMRFLTDWIAGDMYYRIARPDQNRDRARAQFRLLSSMPGTVTTL